MMKSNIIDIEGWQYHATDKAILFWADEQSLARAMEIAEVAVQQMAEEGIDPMHRAIGLAFHMQAQADLAMPTPETAAAFKASLATS